MDLRVDLLTSYIHTTRCRTFICLKLMLYLVIGWSFGFLRVFYGCSNAIAGALWFSLCFLWWTLNKNVTYYKLNSVLIISSLANSRHFLFSRADPGFSEHHNGTGQLLKRAKLMVWTGSTTTRWLGSQSHREESVGNQNKQQAMVLGSLIVSGEDYKIHMG